MSSAKILLETEKTRILGDTLTPVSLFLRLRDRFPGTILLESTDFQPNENCFTYLCVNPIASFKAAGLSVEEQLPGQVLRRTVLSAPTDVQAALEAFTTSFEVAGDPDGVANGFFGYSAYDSVSYFEDLTLKAERDAARVIPELFYQAFQYIIAINHYRHEMYILENRPKETASLGGDALARQDLLNVIERGTQTHYDFRCEGGGESNFNDEEYMEVVRACKRHIHRGDVFQIVPSRRFAQPYSGDDFNVYRALRYINPSPYLFYFDYGSFRIFGSSPEAELIVKDGKATIFPIAGTCRRSGDDDVDRVAVEALKADPKENAEHVMLVDLARNDLSKHCSEVHVERFREVEYFSHVIHLVSKVTGTITSGVSTVALLADTFPAGTLSGAPKYRAMELIDQYERGHRSFYGGAIGYLGFNGDCNHAIMIRSFLSKDGTLYRQAGGGVVADSDPELELQEVNNKLGALKAALKMAEELQP